MSDNIKVVVKVRPLIARELNQKIGCQWRVNNNTLLQIDNHGKDVGSSFTFDKVYDKDSKTQDLYNDVAKPIVEAAVAGFNGTIFAYGQTSSGKTYTMTGTEESPGIIPLAVLNLYDIIKTIPNRDFLVRVSYIEIYNETLNDLLNVENKNIKIRDTLQSGVKLYTTEKVTSTPEEVLEIMKEGEANRQTGATNMNEESSRSHSIFQITIESREHVEGEEESGCVNVSQLNLVDLAGSERAGQTGATGTRFKEGTHINKSLSVLALVIKQLSDDPNKHANYRDSKLTRILQNSLGGNAKTSIVCAVTPTSVEETISTLQFANRAKAVKNKPEVNAVATNATMIQSLTKELSKLQSELVGKKNLEQDNVNLQRKIAQLQKLILNGFGQRSRIDMLDTTRRKLQLPRRVTISTLHHSIEEDPLPPMPKFCTPSLKYNPLAHSSEFLPVQNSSKLASLPEEPRLVTPPPKDKKVNFGDEIIDLDSDDDAVSDIQACSPYHECFASTKTPPCILRKNAKQAEKNLKDLVELTDREKIYTPSVVELMEKLEQNSNIISRLEDEVDTLTKESKEKDSQMEILKDKILKAEEDIKSITIAKLDLEALCKDCNTKLTDWEVSYENLKKKAKSREDELLSLLEEQRVARKPVETDKPQPRTVEQELLNFMDMSKDISLVNSDNENSTANDEDSQIQDLVAGIQAQLIAKTQVIVELEADIINQRQKIISLENSSQQLHGIVNSVNDKLSCLDTENSFLKSTIETLNSTIENQKLNLETANNDIKSYNSLIQELQIKLTKKDSILNVKINDTLIENMIANEEKFIANNENIKNIIHSLKLTIDSRNKEIDNLKSNALVNSHLITDNMTLKEQINDKEKQIYILIKEIDNLKDNLNDNVTVISELLKVEKEITHNLNVVQEENNSLKGSIAENNKYIENLNQNKEILSLTITESKLREQIISDKNLALTKQIQDTLLKITSLEKYIIEKDDLIAYFLEVDKGKQEYLVKAKSTLGTLQSILITLDCNNFELPHLVADYDTFFNKLHEGLNFLKITSTAAVEQTKITVNKSALLQQECSAIEKKLQSELALLKSQLDILNIERNDIIQKNKNVSQQVIELTNDLDKIRNELNTKCYDTIDIETKLNDAKESNQNLRNDLLCKDNIISSLQEKISSLLAEVQLLSQDKELHNMLNKEVENLKSKVLGNEDLYNQSLCKKDKEISEILDSGKVNIETLLEEKRAELLVLTQKLNDALESRDQLLEIILNRASEIISDFNIDNNTFCDLESDISTHEYIMLALQQIAKHMTLINSHNCNEHGNVKETLSEAKTQINELTQQNLKLLNDFSEIDNKNQVLLDEIDKIKSINVNLSGTSDLLEQLKIELNVKAREIDVMELKARELRDQFAEFECIMKQQKDSLQQENEKLKQQMMASEKKTISDGIVLDSDNNECHIPKTLSTSIKKNEIKSPQSLLTISYNKLRETLQLNETDYSSLTTSSSKSFIEVHNAETQAGMCECIQLSLQLKIVNEENLKLVASLMQLENINRTLIKEREEVRKEVKLLLEPADELQKRLSNHRTNLSTFTATTYAENKLLNSQLKVLKHHHTRYIHVCQRDIPAFKSQLHELMVILKGHTSLTDKQNASFKRYSLPDILDDNTTLTNLKNESTLDGDLLMLDSNVTSADNTLTGHDQTCLDITQINFDNEVACQTNDKEFDPFLIYSQIELLTNDNKNINEELETLAEENEKLRQQFAKCANNPSSTIHKVDAHGNPVKINMSLNQNQLENRLSDGNFCKNCEHIQSLKDENVKLLDVLKMVSQELSQVKTQREAMETKYTNLMPAKDALVKKLNIIEKEYNNKLQEITNDLITKNALVKELQEENITLSTQVMDNISEVDDLKKELDSLKELNTKLCGQITEESIGNATNIAANCPQSLLKDDLNLKFEIRSNLNRSLSDSASSSRYNTICTLQNELHASKKDCQKITDEVATIKNQLERSNLSITQSMDLDGSVDDVNLFACNKDFDSEIRLNQYDLPHIPEEVDDYRLDQMECLNYYMERTGAEKENLTSTKIIDVMKMFYNFLTTKHGNEVENLLNKLRDFEESKNVLVLQFKNVTTEYSKVNQELNERRNNLENVTNILSHIRNNSDFVIQEFSNVDVDNANKTKLFKETILRVLDSQFGLSTVEVFEVLIDIIGDEHHKDLNDHMERYAQLQEQMESILVEFSNVSDNLSQIKSELSGKEKEYNILKTEKEKVYEICNAVTLDIIKKENDLKEIIAHACKKILELNIMRPENIDFKLPVKETLELLFEHVINQFKNLHQSVIEKENMIVEVQKSQTALERKEVELQLLKSKFVDKEAKLEENIALYKDLKEIYDNKVKENNINMHIVNNLTEDLKVLKEEVAAKETVIQTLENEITTKQSNIKVKEDYLIELTHKIEDLVQENENLSSAVKNLETDMNSVQQNATTKGGDQLMELIQRISDLTNENETLKSLNQMIESEKESCAKDLAKTREIIDKNKLETEKLTSDIHVLNDAIKDNISKIETLKLDVKSLMQQNLQLKEQFESKCQACSRLEMNIKTHEKTAEIQSRMIMRLQKQKDEDDKIMNNKDTQLEELTQKCLTLQVECDEVKVYMKKSKGEIGQLKDVKESLETRISEMEIEMGKQKNRLSSDALSENSRRRRRSIHDSKRMFGEDHNNMEAVFESCTKSDDLFMDVDEHSSSRSTPTRLSRGRDSFQSRPDQNEKDEETPSRPSSVLATRRRRQSTHDLHRSVVEPTPNGLGDASADNPSVKITDVSADIVSADTSGGNDSEVSQLRERLANCQQELEELKDKYRELDDECETCAQYLQERDEQCSRLKKEKSALENQVTELNEKLKTNQDRSNTESKTSFVHASVNTDEDWTKLHSVVVDRMSFDAEVEKNKKLTKTIEELRYKKQELKYTLAKMEKTLENYNNNRDKRELDTVKGELKACKQELVALRQRYKELDEECETCAEYLRERDEQCRKLKEAKTALEVKLQQFQDERAVAQSVRKKRQSLHDQNRAPSPDLIDASTETSDFLSYQVERDDKPQKANENAHAREIKHLKKALDKVSKEKVALEHLAASAQMANAMNPILPAMYVATGSAIVQNQQLTDVMKENQKLKKVNSKLIQICKKRGKTMHESNRENEEHTEQG